MEQVSRPSDNSKPRRQCRGHTLRGTRCLREQETVFCDDHRFQPWLLLVFIFGAGPTVYFYWDVIRSFFAPPLHQIENVEYRALVAETLRAFEPNTDMHVGGAKVGPDGERTVDITLRNVVDSELVVTLIDTWDIPSGEPVGIDAVDTIDARKADLGARFAFVFSNTGFDEPALMKAKRVGIGLLTVLRRGDQRARAVIEETVYLRRISLGASNIFFDWGTEADKARVVPFAEDAAYLKSVLYEGKSVVDWLLLKATRIVYFNLPLDLAPGVAIQSDYRFMQPITVQTLAGDVHLKAAKITFKPTTEWLYQTVQLDATNAIFDYVRGRVRLAPGQNSYTISGIEFDTAKPLIGPPPSEGFGVGPLRPGETDMALLQFTGMGVTAGAPLDHLVVPEDLELSIK